MVVSKLSRGEKMCPPPLAADLRPCAHGSALPQLWWPGLGAQRLAGPGGTDRQTGPTDKQTDRSMCHH